MAKGTYRIGVVVESKERYDHLMSEHNKGGYFDIKFIKGISPKYLEKDEYPMVVNGITEREPFDYLHQLRQLQNIINDRYTVIIEKD